jgi:predicted nucleic acid-binding protein
MDSRAASAARVIVVDSSIWIDHLRKPDSELGKLLMLDHALMHPHVLGEIALGNLGQRKSIIDRFLMLPVPNIASEGHVLSMIETGGFIATGIGYTDAHLLASTLITPGGRLWTRDKRLHAQAERLGIAYTD